MRRLTLRRRRTRGSDVQDFSPDIEFYSVQIGGVNDYPVRTFWRPVCMRCKWSDEPYPTRKQAEEEAAVHLKLGCLVHYST